VPLSTIFQLYRGAVSVIGGGNRSTLKKTSTCHKSRTNFITMLYRVRLVMNGVRTHNV